MKYFAPWDTSVPTPTAPSSTQPPHFIHPPHYAELDDFDNFALSTNICMCEDQHQIGTQRIKNLTGSKCAKCRSCGLERVKAPNHYGANTFLMRRAQSDESLSNSCHNNNFNNNDPYELMRRRRMQQQDPWYDDHDLDYAEADYIYNSGGRKQPPPRAVLRQQVVGGGRSLDRRTLRSDTNSSGRNTLKTSMSGGSSGTKKQVKDMRQQQQQQQHSDTTKTGASQSRSSDNHSFRTSLSNRSSRSNGSDNIVTVNGGHGTKNSSIIYLSPDTKKPPKPQRNKDVDDPWNGGTTLVTVNHPVHMKVQQHSTTIEVRNSETSTGSEPFTEEEDTGSDISDESSDTSDKERTSSGSEDQLQSVITNENLKLLNKVKVFQEKQKAEQQEKENKEAIQELDRALDIGSEESDYDADCSQLESPRKVQNVIASLLSDSSDVSPNRSPRKRQAVVIVPEAAAIPEEEEAFDSFQTIGSLSRKSVDNLPRGGKKAAASSRLLLDQPASTKSAQLVERRSKQISKESRSISDTSIASGLASKPVENEEDFKPKISKGFSCEILKELYGSKTSLVRKPSSSSGGESAISGGDHHAMAGTGDSYRRRQRLPGECLC